MIDIPHNLHLQIQELQLALESINHRLFLLEASITNIKEHKKDETLERRLAWLENDYQDQQMQINNLLRRISNDFPVATWED